MKNIPIDYSATISTRLCKSTLSWKAIFAGVVAALSTATLFNLLGLALGLSVFSPNTDAVVTIGSSSLIWLAVTGVISMFIGGWVSGKVIQFRYKNGGLHGFITWSVATLLILFLTTSTAGTLITAGAVSVLNKDTAVLIEKTNETTQNISQLTSQTTINPQDVEKASHVIGFVAFATFCMFLLSAISGVIGGITGGRYTYEIDEIESVDVKREPKYYDKKEP